MKEDEGIQELQSGFKRGERPLISLPLLRGERVYTYYSKLSIVSMGVSLTPLELHLFGR